MSIRRYGQSTRLWPHVVASKKVNAADLVSPFGSSPALLLRFQPAVSACHSFHFRELNHAGRHGARDCVELVR